MGERKKLTKTHRELSRASVSMEEIMDASRGLSLLHNRPPTEPKPLIPILPFHTSFQSTHTTHIHLPLPLYSGHAL